MLPGRGLGIFSFSVLYIRRAFVYTFLIFPGFPGIPKINGQEKGAGLTLVLLPFGLLLGAHNDLFKQPLLPQLKQ